MSSPPWHDAELRAGTFGTGGRITNVIYSYYIRNIRGLMTLTVKLDEQDQARLEYLKQFMNAPTQSEVVRKLINERFSQLQADKTLVERRGGHPGHLMRGGSGLSERQNRKATVAKQIEAKLGRRRSK
jgi:hypothetical protein